MLKIVGYIRCGSRYNILTIAESLLARGAAINQVSNDGVTPLLIACQQGRLSLDELLLARGALISQTNNNGATPFYVACLNGHREVVELLLASGALVNRGKSDGVTPLCLACDKGHFSIAKLLISVSKFNGYTRCHLKDIIISCVNGHQEDRTNAMSFCIIAYRCYKQLQLIDPSYTPNDRERSIIGHGRVQQERQTHTLLSLFFDHRKRCVENVLPEEVWRKVTTYLPLSWLRNDDNTTTQQISVS